MQFEKLKINISVNNYVHTFYYSCNQATTFSDLLEYFSFLSPYLNICNCYQFFGAIDNKNIDQQCVYISHQSKVEDFKSFLNNIIIKKNNDKCQHNKQNFLLASKKFIISYFQSIISEKNKEIEQYKKENSSLKEKSSGNVFFKQSSDGKPADFYDVIVHINSVKDIIDGWKIEMNENGEKNYKEFKNKNILKIGVIGNANKGKSHLLSKLSKINLPSGMTIKTEGLSIKYPEIQLKNKRKIVLLDSAGLETPVLISDEKKEKEKNGAKEEKGKIGEKDKNKEKENNEKNEGNKLFKEKSREKLITELFLQNYIVNNSDILLVVVDFLSYSEQKLLMKIKKERERSNKQSKLYVIHNLKAYTSKIQVQDYIDKTLLKSATFKLVLGNKDPNEDGIFFCEIPNDKKNKKELDIYHLIYANEDSEAGKYYNPFTLKFIEQYYNYINNLGNYDVIQTIKERFIEKYGEIVEKGGKIDMNSFDNCDRNYIKLKNEKEIILKQCFIDELGFSNLKPNGFEPKYNIFQEGNKIIVRVEVPGHSIIQSDIDESENYKIIKLAGEKLRDSKPEKIEENIHNAREFGNFSLEIPVSLPKNYIFKRENPVYKKIDGLHIFEYNLEEKIKTFIPKQEKESEY